MFGSCECSSGMKVTDDGGAELDAGGALGDESVQLQSTSPRARVRARDPHLERQAL